MIGTHSSDKKTMLLTARCSAPVKDALTILSRSENLSKSEIISKSVLDYYQRHLPHDLAEMEKNLFGKYKSGKKDLSANRKEYFLKSLLEKHSHR